MAPALFAPWALQLAAAANFQPGERALDLACGTGVVTRRLLAQTGALGTVIGLDLNPKVLKVAREAAGRNHGAVSWCVGRGERLPFVDANFDLIVCQFGLMFFADWLGALSEMRRVLRPGGRLIVSVWQGLERHPFHQTLDEVSRRHLGKSSVQAVFALGEADEADVLYRLLTEAGFESVAIKQASITAQFSDPAAFLEWEIGVDPAETPALRNLDVQAQAARLAAMRRELQAPFNQIIQGEAAVLTYHAHVAKARRP
jgi:ubiquinone/menaquinone biosynthesis C-methylase UbiE